MKVTQNEVNLAHFYLWIEHVPNAFDFFGLVIILYSASLGHFFSSLYMDFNCYLWVVNKLQLGSPALIKQCKVSESREAQTKQNVVDLRLHFRDGTCPPHWLLESIEAIAGHNPGSLCPVSPKKAALIFTKWTLLCKQIAYNSICYVKHQVVKTEWPKFWEKKKRKNCVDFISSQPHLKVGMVSLINTTNCNYDPHLNWFEYGTFWAHSFLLWKC